MCLFINPDVGPAPGRYHICYSEILDPSNQWQSVYTEYRATVRWLLFIDFFTKGADSPRGETLGLETYLFFQGCLVGSHWLGIPVRAQEFYKIGNFISGAGDREGRFRILDWSASFGQREIGPVVLFDAADPQSGEREGASPMGVAWPSSIPPSPPPSLSGLSNTLTHWVFCLQIDFVNLNTEYMGKRHTF